MAELTSRWYRDDDDLARVLTLVRAAIVAGGADGAGFHPGDVVWELFPNPTVDPATRVRLFEDAQGALRGVAWIHPPRDVSLHHDPAHPLGESELAVMIRWVEGHLGPGGPFGIEAIRDERIMAAVTAAGYRPTGEVAYQLNTQVLSAPTPEPELPAGAVVRPVRSDDPDEVAARVALHREVWEPSKFTQEGYVRLRARPIYRPDLDLVAVTPAGELAAYCIVWWDPVVRTGLFEPVGAALAHRRQGYAKALMYDGLRRLRALGATEAIVVSETAPAREASRRLYAATGFTVRWRFAQWSRDPAPLPERA